MKHYIKATFLNHHNARTSLNNLKDFCSDIQYKKGGVLLMTLKDKMNPELAKEYLAKQKGLMGYVTSNEPFMSLRS